MKNIQKVLSVFLSIFLICIMALPLNVTAQAAAKKKITSCAITYTSSVAYTGKALKPKVTVKDGKTTLKSGTHYTVKYSSNKAFGTGKITVTGVSKNGYTGSKTLNFKIVPGKPSVSVSTTSTTAKLSWKKVAGATKYIIYKYNSSNKKYEKLATTTKTSYTVKSLKANSTTYFKIKASATSNKKTYTSDYSKKITAKTAPAKVTNLAATSTESTVKLTWKKVSGANSYTVYKYDSSKKSYSKVKSGITSTSYTVSSLKAGTAYKYAVAAYNKSSGKTGDKSSVVTISTKAAVTAPAKVTNLTATPTDTTVKLAWSAVSGATSYTVYSYNSSKKTYTEIKSGITSTSYTISALKEGKTYSYAVAAVTNKNGKTATGSKSSVVSVKTHNYLTNLTNCYNLIRSGTFTIKCEFDGMTPQIYVKNNKLAFELNETIDGISIQSRVFYSEKKGKYYILADAMGLNLYSEMTKEEYNSEFDLNAQQLIDNLAPVKDNSAVITSSTKTVGNKKYNCESYTSKNGIIVTYYFYNGNLSIIETKNNKETLSVNVSDLSKTVSNSVFELPALFPIGWIKID